ncbi:MAG: SpoIID/LytB domain-containing protein [Planctomycetes bacterium]|nr:SpoIID/LytB domain-containing protein [Planctomycetota bacterium]
MIKHIGIVLFFLMFLLVSCANFQSGKSGPELLAPIPTYGAAPLVRVKLSKPSTATTLQVDAGKAIISLDGVRTEATGKISISLDGTAINVEGFGQAAFVEIAPALAPEHFSVDNRVYRGRLRVISCADGWDVINVVDLEQYVAGVVGWEMITGWPLEALKAQAVASRTYAVFEMEYARGNGRAWDLDDTTAYQVYGGVGPADKPKQWRETPNVLLARESTNGVILTYQGKGFRAFFHSTSGGHTVNPPAGLGIDETIPPLAGVDLGEFGKDSPKHRWEQRMPAGEVKARLIEKKISPSDLIRIEAAETAPSGHAVTVKLYDRKGHHRVIPAVDLRRVLGLFSTNFTAEKQGDEWVFTGRGYGHGCGMCQWSAKGMAAAGWKSERILETMYPGSEQKSLY